MVESSGWAGEKRLRLWLPDPVSQVVGHDRLFLIAHAPLNDRHLHPHPICRHAVGVLARSASGSSFLPALPRRQETRAK